MSGILVVEKGLKNDGPKKGCTKSWRILSRLSAKSLKNNALTHVMVIADGKDFTMISLN